MSGSRCQAYVSSPADRRGMAAQASMARRHVRAVTLYFRDFRGFLLRGDVAMRRLMILAVAGVAALGSAPLAQQQPAANVDPIKAASDALGVAALKTLRITGF